MTRKVLPIDFTPGVEHVVIEKGKKYSNHSGNLRLRQLVQTRVECYLKAHSKSERSFIIMQIIHSIRASSTYGGFVRKDKVSGRWFRADNPLARERTSQVFRDVLHKFYKSSRRNRRNLERRTHDRKELNQSAESPTDKRFSHSHCLAKSFYIDEEHKNDHHSPQNGSYCSIHESTTACDFNYDSLFFRLCSSINENDNDPFEPRPMIERATPESLTADHHDNLCSFAFGLSHNENDKDPFEPEPIEQTNYSPSHFAYSHS